MMCTRIFLIESVAAAILSATSLAAAANVYFDTVDGNDANDGTTEATPKKTIKITSGSTIYIRRGSTYSGNLNLNNVSVQTYGCGPRVVVNGSLTVSKSAIEGLHAKPSSGSAINVQSGSTVRDCEADGSVCTKSAMGIMVMGEDNRIIGNYVHDFSVSQSGSSANNSGGAEGIMVMASNNEIAFNSVVNCQSVNTTLGGFEGGCLEIVNGKGAGQTIHNVSFHHNYCEKSVGLFEGCSGNYSATAGGVMDNHGIIENVTVSYNVSVDAMWLFLLQTVNTDFKNVVFANNTIIHSPKSAEYWDSGGGHFTMAIVYDSDTSTGTTIKADNEYFKQDGGFQPGTVAVRNNIFIDNIGSSRNAMMMANMTDHSNNLFVPANASVSFAFGGKSGFALNDTESKVDLSALALSDDYQLTAASSAAIDKGVAVSMDKSVTMAGTPLNAALFEGAFSQDVAHQSVPCGSAPDIGASEYCDGVNLVWPGPSDSSSCPGEEPSTGGAKSSSGGSANTNGGATAAAKGGAPSATADGTATGGRAASNASANANLGGAASQTTGSDDGSEVSAGGDDSASTGKGATNADARGSKATSGSSGGESGGCTCRVTDARDGGLGSLSLGALGVAVLALARRRARQR